MDTTRDDNNEELGRIARQLFEARCPLTTVRQLEGDPLGYLPGLWREMAGLDWLSLTYPEALGGAGGTMVDLSVIYQELGRALVPSPHLASAVIAGETLVGDESGRHRDLLASMVAGEAVVVARPHGARRRLRARRGRPCRPGPHRRLPDRWDQAVGALRPCGPSALGGHPHGGPARRGHPLPRRSEGRRRGDRRPAQRRRSPALLGHLQPGRRPTRGRRGGDRPGLVAARPGAGSGHRFARGRNRRCREAALGALGGLRARSGSSSAGR